MKQWRCIAGLYLICNWPPTFWDFFCINCQVNCELVCLAHSESQISTPKVNYHHADQGSLHLGIAWRQIKIYRKYGIFCNTPRPWAMGNYCSLLARQLIQLLSFSILAIQNINFLILQCAGYVPVTIQHLLLSFQCSMNLFIQVSECHPRFHHCSVVKPTSDHLFFFHVISIVIFNDECGYLVNWVTQQWAKYLSFGHR